MATQIETKFSSMKNIDRQKGKNNQKKATNIRSHIIFQGDPAYQQESIDYIPVGRRKKIFEDKQTKILPPDLFLDQSAHLQNPTLLNNQREIQENMMRSFDRQVGPTGYSIRPNKKSSYASRKQQIYFQPNNLQTDLNFGATNGEQIQPGFRQSRASQMTQKKVGFAYQSTLPSTNPAMLPGVITSEKPQIMDVKPQINFSYQGKEFPKQSDQVVQSRVQSRIQREQNSSPKSRAKSIFLNEGGVMMPKTKKIPLHESNYYDFVEGDNGNFADNLSVGNSLAYAFGNQVAMTSETPEFNAKIGSNNGKSNELINNTIINGFKSFESQTNFNKLNKSIIQNEKFQLNDMNYPPAQNPNNSSQISYKSIQKQQFETDRLGSNLNSRSKVEEQKKNNMQNRKSQVIEVKSSTIKPEENLIIKTLQSIGKNELKKTDQSNSMSFQEDQKSLFDQLLRERQAHFSKNKPPEEVYPRKSSDRRNSSIKVITNESKVDEARSSVHRPSDFISDFNSAPKNLKRSININNVEGRDYEKARHEEGEHNQALGPKGESILLESKVRKIEINKETAEQKNDTQTVKNKTQITSKKKKHTKIKEAKMKKGKKRYQKDADQDYDEQEEQEQQIEQSSSIDEVDSEDEEDSSEQMIYNSKPRSRKQKKQIRKNQNDNQLEDFLQKQKEKIHLKEIKKYMDHVPQIKDNLNKKNKKSLSPRSQAVSQVQNMGSSQPTVAIANTELLTPQQKQLLLAVGIKFIDANQASNYPSNSLHTSNHNNPSHLSKQSAIPNNNDLPNHQHQGSPLVMNEQNKSQQLFYHHNPEEFENKFLEINRTLYKELNKFLLQKQITNQVTGLTHGGHSQIISNPVQQQNQSLTYSNNLHQPDSHITFNQNKNHYVHHEFNPSRNQTAYNLTGPKKDHRKTSKEEGELYNRQIYNQLKRFNRNNESNKNNLNDKRSVSREKSQPSYRGESPDDSSTHYYSFYHQDNKDISPQPKNYYSPRNRNEHFIDYDSYYPLRQRREVPVQREVKNEFKNKFDIRTKFSNSQLELLYRKLQQLTKEIHEQLPMIRDEIQQNQKEIRKIETNLLIKNTAQQHNLIKILQKMKIKDIELQQKALEAESKDQELSFYQNELVQLKHQFYGEKQLTKQIETENLFEKRLEKIRNYNQNLCSKISKAKIKGKALP